MAPTSHPSPPAPWLALQQRVGAAVTVGGVTATPQSRVLTLRLPFGAFVWHRPSAVLVQQGGVSTRLPIRDATRWAQRALIGGAVCFALVGRAVATKAKERGR